MSVTIVFTREGHQGVMSSLAPRAYWRGHPVYQDGREVDFSISEPVPENFRGCDSLNTYSLDCIQFHVCTSERLATFYYTER